jgi:hypothetical protein
MDKFPELHELLDCSDSLTAGLLHVTKERYNSKSFRNSERYKFVLGFCLNCQEFGVSSKTLLNFLHEPLDPTDEESCSLISLFNDSLDKK